MRELVNLGRGAVVHIVFAIVFLFFLLYDAMEDKASANFWISVFIFADFFVFSFLNLRWPELEVNRFIIPVWFLAALYFSKKGKIKSVLVAAVIILYVYGLYDVFAESVLPGVVGMEIVGEEEKKETIGFVKRALENLKKSLSTFAEKQANATLGEYYTGEIDRKAKERLGVYIENLQAADREFFEDQPVNIWATLVAKTLDEPIEVEIGCTVDGEIIEGVEIYPKEIFEVESFEEEGIECSFEPGLLREGYHEISMNAKFNFLTMAYIKTYFMDPERRRVLMREGIDPLENYGIVERDPRAVYTNGPIMIGLDVGKPPLSADKDFRLGTTLTNWWDGEIQKVTDFYIVTPNEMELEKNEEGVYSCRGKRNYIFDSSSCSEIGEEEKGCDDNIHNVFKIEHDAIEIREIENYETILCRLYVQDQNDLLGDVPLVTKYLKVVAKYDYNIHEEIGIQVKGGDGVRTVLADGECAKKCIDDDGCLCPAGCEISKGQHIYKDMTCGGSEVEEVIEEGGTFAEGWCGSNRPDTWVLACGGCDKDPQGKDLQDGIHCLNNVWTCTTDSDGSKARSDPTYHDIKGCPET